MVSDEKEEAVPQEDRLAAIANELSLSALEKFWEEGDARKMHPKWNSGRGVDICKGEQCTDKKREKGSNSCY